MWRMMLGAAVLIAGVVGGVAGVPGQSLTCHVREDARTRVYVLEATDSGQKAWRLAMQDGESAGKWIRLALPGAAPVFGDGTASLSYKNANGGRQVSVDVARDHARLDVYVDHGLEVNIEPDLDPAVDRMNTNGPLTALDCTVTRPGSMPGKM
jgi:hypothetical protein